MPSTPSFVEQIHIGILCEATADAHLELLTPWKAPFAYYGTDTSPQDYACKSFTDVIRNTQIPGKILLARRSFTNASTQHQNIRLALYSFQYIIKHLYYSYLYASLPLAYIYASTSISLSLYLCVSMSLHYYLIRRIKKHVRRYKHRHK